MWNYYKVVICLYSHNSLSSYTSYTYIYIYIYENMLSIYTSTDEPRSNGLIGGSSCPLKPYCWWKAGIQKTGVQEAGVQNAGVRTRYSL